MILRRRLINFNGVHCRVLACVACLRFVRDVGRVLMQELVNDLSSSYQHVLSTFCLKGLFPMIVL